MMLLCPVDSNLTGLEAVGFFTDVAVLIILATPVAIIYVLCRIFVPSKDSLGANVLRLDPENTYSTRTFCWSGTPAWKLALYALLTVMTLIY